MTETETPQDLAVRLALPLWQGLDRDYKSQYRTTIWQQFEDALRSAAYVETLRQMVSRICSRWPIRLAETDLSTIASLCESGHDRAVLRVLRSETPYVVTLVRLANEERKVKGVRA